MKFVNYIVDYIEFKNNLNFTEEDITIDFDIFPEFLECEDQQDLIVSLEVRIFEDAVQHNYPFEMKIRLVGYFRIEGDDREIDKFKPNAIAIMYPYIRSIVTNYTANANVNPLILPVINVNSLIKNRNNK